LVGCLAGGLFEQSGKVKAAHMRHVSEVIKSQRLVQVRVDVVAQPV
jgi:hypothetical protein